jgi:hypothetical protein
VNAQPREVGGVPLPPHVFSYDPGIALDTTWQAAVGVNERELTDIDGLTAFTTARQLALESSTQWLQGLESAMNVAGHGAFWDKVKTVGAPFKTDTEPWERFDLMPYRFMTVGDYPPDANDDGGGWFAWVRIKTSDDALAGTDADITVIIDGEEFGALDFAPGHHPIVAHNDFERDSIAAYVVGPLAGHPTSITLRNDAPRPIDVLEALVDALVRAVIGAIERARDFMLSIIAGHADLVAEDKIILDAEALSNLAPGGEVAFVGHLDGGRSGHYRVSGAVSFTGATSEPQAAAVSDASGVMPWREYRIELRELICVEESTLDRWSTADEPFVCFLGIPHGGTDVMVKWRSKPFADVDTGERRRLDKAFTLRVPPLFGFLSIALAVFEHDSESSLDRQRLLEEFANEVRDEIDTAQKSFVAVLAESIGSAWKVDSVEVTAFERGQRASVTYFRALELDRWLKAGRSVERTLTARRTEWTNVPGQPAPLDPRAFRAPASMIGRIQGDGRPPRMSEEERRVAVPFPSSLPERERRVPSLPGSGDDVDDPT